MEYVAGYLMALGVVAAGFLGVILALVVLEVSKAKFAVSLILSLILIGLGGYYYYVVSQMEKGVANPNILNSLLKVSSTQTAPPAVILPEVVPLEMIPPVPRRKDISGSGETEPPISVRVKKPTTRPRSR